MIEKFTKYKNYIIGLALMIMLSTLFLGTKYLMKPKYEELPEVKLKDIKSKKSFAIMIQNGDTYKEYTSEDNTWPGSDYVYKEAKCTDNNGALVANAITFADGKATLKTNQTIYCTLYFDERPIPDIVKNLIAKDREASNGVEHLSTKSYQGGMYRYQGTDDVPNWICFGTTDNCGIDETDSDGNSIPDGIDKYMYRIIGITEEGQMYLIKETFIKEGIQKTFAWNDKYYVDSSQSTYCDNGLCPEWNTSILFKRINGTSNGTQTGSGATLNKEWTDIFVDSTQYDYLKSGDSNSGGEASEWYNLIADHEWMYGDTITADVATYTGDTVYAIEIGQAETSHYVGTKGNITQQTYKWPAENKVKAKISLMYIHDYIYSYYDGSTEESRGNPKNYSTAKNGWLFFQKDGYQTDQYYEWLSTRCGVYSTSSAFVGARYVINSGRVDSITLSYAFGVRPVFYLESKAKIASGDGTKNSPFILE